MLTVRIMFIFLALVYSFSWGSTLPTDQSLDAFTENQPILKNFKELNRLGTNRGQVSWMPWANREWPHEKAMIADRYADSSWNSLSLLDRQINFEKDTVESLRRLSSKDRLKKLDILSPSEKYDLFVGDEHRTLTRANFKDSLEREKNGTLTYWNGLCEGTALASIYVPEPKNPVKLKTPFFKEEIIFYPKDIKALLALVWSSYTLDDEIPVLGQNCKAEQGNCDSSIHPATTHLALTNLFSKQSKPIFFDMDPSEEIWNNPLVSFEMTFFNRKTMETHPLLSGAIVSRANFGTSELRNRDSNTEYLVGVSVRVTHAASSEIDRAKIQAAPLYSQFWIYDLELDQNYEIVGGEWISKDRPDFMWAPRMKKPYPLSLADRMLAPELSSHQPLHLFPQSWLGPVLLSSERLQPMKFITDFLVKESFRQ